jgi:hypothetical protein
MYRHLVENVRPKLPDWIGIAILTATIFFTLGRYL